MIYPNLVPYRGALVAMAPLFVRVCPIPYLLRKWIIVYIFALFHSSVILTKRILCKWVYMCLSTYIFAWWTTRAKYLRATSEYIWKHRTRNIYILLFNVIQFVPICADRGRLLHAWSAVEINKKNVWAASCDGRMAIACIRTHVINKNEIMI